MAGSEVFAEARWMEAPIIVSHLLSSWKGLERLKVSDSYLVTFGFALKKKKFSAYDGQC